jgi:hypothetical protein
MHSSAIGEHSGAPVTYRRLKQLIAWKGKKTNVYQFIKSCQICLQPSKAWEIISPDFVEDLPQSGNKNCILVIMDKFMRYGHFIPLAHPYSARSVAVLFVNTVYKMHELSASIISDRDPIFTSKFWQCLF